MKGKRPERDLNGRYRYFSFFWHLAKKTYSKERLREVGPVNVKRKSDLVRILLVLVEF